MGGPGGMLVQGRALRHGQHGRRCRLGERNRPGGKGGHEDFRSRWPVAEPGVRAHAVVMPPPALDDYLHFSERVEDLPMLLALEAPPDARSCLRKQSNSAAVAKAMERVHKLGVLLDIMLPPNYEVIKSGCKETGWFGWPCDA
jgi:hypothetical protein